MNSQSWIMLEQRVRRSVIVTATYLALAVLALMIPFCDALRPSTESVATWWQRAGAPVAVFAFIAQNKAQYLSALLTPGSFTSPEMEALRGRYRWAHQIGQSAAIILTVIGTVVWGYGDYFVNAVQHALAPIAAT